MILQLVPSFSWAIAICFLSEVYELHLPSRILFESRMRVLSIYQRFKCQASIYKLPIGLLLSYFLWGLLETISTSIFIFHDTISCKWTLFWVAQFIPIPCLFSMEQLACFIFYWTAITKWRIHRLTHLR